MRKRIDTSEYKNIASLYNKGESAVSISKIYKVNAGAIRTALKKSGVIMRDKISANKLYCKTHKSVLIEKSNHMRKCLSTDDYFCKKCGTQYVKISYTQKWCKICAPDKKAINRLAAYNISQPEYVKMIKDVNGICPICLKRPAEVIDHNHTTGKVRGIICCHCNTSLHLIENKEALNRAIKYLGAQ